jgi:hypothetical protein
MKGLLLFEIGYYNGGTSAVIGSMFFGLRIVRYVDEGMTGIHGRMNEVI